MKEGLQFLVPDPRFFSIIHRAWMFSSSLDAISQFLTAKIVSSKGQRSVYLSVYVSCVRVDCLTYWMFTIYWVCPLHWVLEIQWWLRHSPRSVRSSAFMGKDRCKRNHIKIISTMQEILWQKTCLWCYRAHNKSMWRGGLQKTFLSSYIHYVPYAAQTVLSLESHLSFLQYYFITPGLSFFVYKMGDDKIIVMVIKGDSKTFQGLEQHPAHNSATLFGLQAGAQLASSSEKHLEFWNVQTSSQMLQQQK